VRESDKFDGWHVHDCFILRMDLDYYDEYV